MLWTVWKLASWWMNLRVMTIYINIYITVYKKNMFSFISSGYETFRTWTLTIDSDIFVNFRGILIETVLWHFILRKQNIQEDLAIPMKCILDLRKNEI